MRVWIPALLTGRESSAIRVAPIAHLGELLGLIVVSRSLEDAYDAEDDRVLAELARQVGLALHNVRLDSAIQESLAELEVARLIQQNFLPKELPDLDGWQIAAYYRPAREVGGDFYDVIPLPGGLVAFVVGDVTDKGVPAALVMSATRAILRASATRIVEPGAVLEAVNEHLCPDMPEKMFVTCLYGVLDPASGLLRFANAGHDVPYVKTADGVVELRARGMPLGLLTGMAYEEKEMVLAPGDGVLLHSDGIVEAHDPEREMYGFPRLQETVRSGPVGQALIYLVLAEIDAFTGPDSEQEDDITMLTLARTAAPPDAEVADDGELLAQFELPSEPGNERQAITQVERAVADLRLPDARLERLKTAVGEATMNAIEHGNQNVAERPVFLRVLHSPGRLRVQVTDYGAAGELPARETPDIEAKLAGLQKPRGWGLFLIDSMVDETRVTRDARGHTLELIVHLEGESDDDE